MIACGSATPVGSDDCADGEYYVEGEGCVSNPAQCPATMPEPGTDCSETVTCSWGEERCCGVTHPSEQCFCEEGRWRCSATDACLGGPSSCCPTGETYVEGQGCLPDETLCPAEFPVDGSACNIEGLDCPVSCEPCEPCYLAMCSAGTWVIMHGDPAFYDWFEYDNGTCMVDCICGDSGFQCIESFDWCLSEPDQDCAAISWSMETVMLIASACGFTPSEADTVCLEASFDETGEITSVVEGTSSTRDLDPDQLECVQDGLIGRCDSYHPGSVHQEECVSGV